MITPEKIEAWIKEVTERPASAPVLIQFVGNRLRELAQRNEDLLAENIALMTDKRTEEYEQRIAHLEYQLDLLKRQFGGDLSASELLPPQERPAGQTLGLYVFHPQGRVLRLALPPVDGTPQVVGRLQGELIAAGEPPRLLAAQSGDELLFVFSSGRIAAHPAGSLPLAKPGADGYDWAAAPIPDEPRAGESLVCLATISKMPLAEYIVQTSRRGYVKKIRAQMAQSILANHYIGAGVKSTSDRTFALALSGKDERLALVSHEGYLQCLDVRKLSSAIEEALRLAPSDHLVAAFTLLSSDSAAESQRMLVVMTQGGKLVHYLESDVATATSTKTRGQTVFSSQRRGQGVRVVGAGMARPEDSALVLDAGGEVRLHPMREVFARGVLPTQADLLAFTLYNAG